MPQKWNFENKFHLPKRSMTQRVRLESGTFLIFGKKNLGEMLI